MSKPSVFKYSPTLLKRLLKCNNNWSSGESSYIKRKLRYHLRQQFKEKCFYCNVELQNGNAKAEIDHIVPKSNYSSFTFRPENLVWSCRECNSTKGTSDPLVDRLRGRTYIYDDYLLNSNDYEIVHAYLDNYDAHIEIDGGLFRISKSKKGAQTILMCGLYRLQLVHDKIKQIIHEQEIRKGAYYEITSIFESDMNQDEYISKISEKVENIDKDLREYKLMKEALDSQELLDLGYTIIRFKNIDLFCEKNKKLYKFFTQKMFILEYYIGLFKYMNHKVSVKKGIVDYTQLIKGEKDFFNYLINYDGYMDFKQKIDSNVINIDNRGKKHFINKRDSLILNQNDFIVLNYIIKNMNTIESLCNEMLTITTTTDFIPLLMDLPTSLIMKSVDISNINLNNLHLKGISKISVLHNWFDDVNYDSRKLKLILKICKDIKEIKTYF